MSYQDGYIIDKNDINKLIAAHKLNGVHNGLSVTQHSPTSMTVVVAAGRAFVNEQLREFDTSTDVTLSTADPNNPRKDIIIINSSGTISKITGTAEAAQPAAQTGPKTFRPRPAAISSNSIILAEIWVEAGETAILNADITDRRVIVPAFLNPLLLMTSLPIDIAYHLGPLGYDGEFLYHINPAGQYQAFGTGFAYQVGQQSGGIAQTMYAQAYVKFSSASLCFPFFFEPKKGDIANFQGFQKTSGAFNCISNKNAVSKTTPISDPGVTSEHRYKITHKTDNTLVLFYIDGALVATHNDPTYISSQPYEIACAEPAGVAMTAYMRYPPGIFGYL